MGAIWDLVTGKSAQEAREELDRQEQYRAQRAASYSDYENPTLAEFIGAENICTVCFATTPEMTRHLAWHAEQVSKTDMNKAVDNYISHRTRS